MLQYYEHASAATSSTFGHPEHFPHFIFEKIALIFNGE
jgi:hypothetical protein